MRSRRFTIWIQANAAHVRPHFLAGTRQILYRVTSRNGRNNSYYVTSLDSATENSSDARFRQRHLFSRPLLFMQNHTLMAQPFDLNRLTITGPPGRSQMASFSPGSLPVFGIFSASQTGRIVYLSATRRL